VRQALIGLVWWGVAAGCRTAEPTPADLQTTLAGVWVADRAGLPPRVIRANTNDPVTAPVVGRSWSFAREGGTWRWCRRDVREGAPVEALRDPCGCDRAEPEDCAGGTLQLEDPATTRMLAAVTLTHDDARSDLAGVLTLEPTGDQVVLGLHLTPVFEEAARRAMVSDGLSGPAWTGGDGLGWYRRQD